MIFSATCVTIATYNRNGIGSPMEFADKIGILGEVMNFAVPTRFRATSCADRYFLTSLIKKGLKRGVRGTAERGGLPKVFTQLFVVRKRCFFALSGRIQGVFNYPQNLDAPPVRSPSLYEMQNDSSIL